MKLTTVVAAVSLMALTVMGEAVRAQRGLPASKMIMDLPEGQDALHLPLEFSGKHIILQLSVNGSEPVSVVLDTGMPADGVVLFDTAQVQALGLEFGSMVAKVGGAGGAGETTRAKVATGLELSLGGVTFSGATAMVLPTTPHFSLNHAGIMGAAVFENLVVTVDHDRGELILTRPSAYLPPEGAVAVPMVFHGNVPHVQADVATGEGVPTPIQLVLDLGANHTLSLNGNHNPALAQPAQVIATQIGRGLSGAMFGHVGRIASFTLGGQTLSDVVVTFPSAEHENPRGTAGLDGNLGMGIMGRFNFTLDYSTKSLYLKPAESFAEPFDWNMSGLSLDAGDGGELVVSHVVPGSPGDVAGMQPGDIVLAVNGREISGAEKVYVSEAFRREGQEILLRYLRGDVSAIVQLTLRPLI